MHVRGLLYGLNRSMLNHTQRQAVELVGVVFKVNLSGAVKYLPSDSETL